jgi:hypothetical protein
MADLYARRHTVGAEERTNRLASLEAAEHARRRSIYIKRTLQERRFRRTMSRLGCIHIL